MPDIPGFTLIGWTSGQRPASMDEPGANWGAAPSGLVFYACDQCAATVTCVGRSGDTWPHPDVLPLYDHRSWHGEDES